MESFQCSSSSFDALNSFQHRRSSSIVVIAEDGPIPSPTFKSLKQFDLSLKSSKRGSNIFQRRRNYTTESSIWCDHIPLNSPETISIDTIPKSRSASIFPPFKNSTYQRIL